MRISKNNILYYSAIVISFILCYLNTFIWLNYRYSAKDSYYSHGYLIPFIFFYLIYKKKERLKDLRSYNNNGIILIVFALAVHIVAVMADINFLSGFSMLLYIIGLTLFLFGSKITKEIAFPLFFLLFMIPVPNEFINFLGLPTKKIATDIGLAFINWLDIPFFREGFRINLVNTSLVVGTPCNGMKSLISFAAIGTLSMYLFNVSLKRGVLLIGSIYPLAVFLNGCRIAILVYIAAKFGIEKASPESFFHDLSGLIVFIFGIIIIMLVINFRQKT